MACSVYREELERRARMWAQGMSIREIAAECFVTPNTIERYVCRYRKFFPRRSPRSSLTERDRARAMRAEGMTYKAIAETLSRHEGTVWHWCNDGGE